MLGKPKKKFKNKNSQIYRSSKIILVLFWTRLH